MKISAYIPIKLNNVRTPGKNIKQLSDGTPLCKLMFNTLSKARNIDEKYCFCSDESIKEYLVPGVEFIQRPAYLDSNETKCHEIIRAFIDKVNPDIIVLTHATSPFLRTETLEKCVNMVSSGEYDSAFTVSRLQEFIWKDGKPVNFDASCTPRSQDLPLLYRETNGVFVFSREVFEETNRRVGFNPYLCEVGFPETADVNYPEDFVIVDAIYSNGLYK
jgi:CMP-N-acetylneuraminic acid synthetase